MSSAPTIFSASYINCKEEETIIEEVIRLVSSPVGRAGWGGGGWVLTQIYGGGGGGTDPDIWWGGGGTDPDIWWGGY